MYWQLKGDIKSIVCRKWHRNIGCLDLDLIWGVKFGMVMREMVAGSGGIRILHYKLYFVTIIHYLSLSFSLWYPQYILTRIIWWNEQYWPPNVFKGFKGFIEKIKRSVLFHRCDLIIEGFPTSSCFTGDWSSIEKSQYQREKLIVLF